MPDDKSPFEKFIDSIWNKISAFIAAVVAIAGFVAPFQEKLVIFSLIALGLITIILAIASFGCYTDQPKTKHLGQKNRNRKNALYSPMAGVKLLGLPWVLSF